MGDTAFGGDPWGGSSTTKSNNRNDDLFTGKSDSWAGGANNGAGAAAAKTNGNHDPWAPKTNGTNGNSTNPWFGSASNGGATNGNGQAAAGDPWGASNGNGHAKIDDFDLFTTNRVQQPATPVNDPFGDFLAADTAAAAVSTNPWGGSDSSKPKQSPASFDPFAPTSSSTVSAAGKPQLPMSTSSSAIRKTPESFLGENSSLVNLENLIPARPKSTNPFGSAINPSGAGGGPTMTSSTSIGQLSNPFMVQQQQQQAMANNVQFQHTATASSASNRHAANDEQWLQYKRHAAADLTLSLSAAAYSADKQQLRLQLSAASVQSSSCQHESVLNDVNPQEKIK